VQTFIKLLRITTVPISLQLLLKGQLPFMEQQGFEVLAVSANGKEVLDITNQGIKHRVVPFTRSITPFQDLVCLWNLIRIIRLFKPHIVHTHTPKAGLLGMLASWLCRVPVRLHTVAGLPLMETKGFTRSVLHLTERITYACAHRVYPNSVGLHQFMEKEFKVNRKWCYVIGKGSSNGIDSTYFKRTEELERQAKAIRQQHNIPEQAVVFCFVGRVVRDKGIGELVEAFREIALENEGKCYLLLVGPFESELDPLEPADYDFLQHNPYVVLAGFQSDVRPWMVASDVFVFPSYREGFPNVVMQACCLEVPCIVTDINGCNEIIDHNQNGLIVQPKNAEALQEAMRFLLDHPDKRRIFATRARNHVVEHYEQRVIWHTLLNEYRSFFPT
jgi:glycosyltransferase involved in cell wall biosynthesis